LIKITEIYIVRRRLLKKNKTRYHQKNITEKIAAQKVMKKIKDVKHSSKMSKLHNKYAVLINN